MARRPKTNDPESLRSELVQLLIEFEGQLKTTDLRSKVLVLVKSFHRLRDLGSSLIPVDTNENNAARDRILQYFRKYVGIVLQSDEFLVVSGIQEYARRIRELRVEKGWSIVSGKTAKEMIQSKELLLENSDQITVDSYILLSDVQDKVAAHRWHLANSLRKENIGIKEKFLRYFKENVGIPVTGEELSYLANGLSEWPRRIRELRTEEGWMIKSTLTGRPDLPMGTYILEEIRQGEVHDRHIPMTVQVDVFMRDNYKCIKCGWSKESSQPGDPRHLLELHHLKHHSLGGKNEANNLVTLCNVHHDDIHKKDKTNSWTHAEFKIWLAD